MKRLLIIFSVVLIASFSFNCNKTNSSSKSGNKQQTQPKPTAYVNNDYNFQVNFLGKPNVQVSKVNTSLGQAEVITFADVQNNLTYLVSVTVYPEQFANQVNASESVKTQVEETAKGMKLTQVRVEENNISGKPSYYYEGQGDNVYAIMQAIAYQNKVYIVAALAEGPDAKQLATTDGVKFIKSFKLF